MNDRDKREQRDDLQEKQHRVEPEDLEVTPEDAADVKGGGKVNIGDFSIVKRIDKSSP